jgi:hypothetical protein
MDIDVDTLLVEVGVAGVVIEREIYVRWLCLSFFDGSKVSKVYYGSFFEIGLVESACL